MSLKRIVYRGGGYARRRDRIRYGENYTLTREEEARQNEEIKGCLNGCCMGCIGVFVFLILFGLALRFVGSFGEGWQSPEGDFIGSCVGFGSIVFFVAFAAYSSHLRKSIKRGGECQPDQSPLEQSIAESYLKCHCQHCNQGMEFPSHGVGQTIKCPACGLDTVLYDDPDG
jgi:hypothetical protein